MKSSGPATARASRCYFDPGRVKKGLKPREELGPILEAGKSYCLVIDRDWLDAAGKPLACEFRKPFRAGPADDDIARPEGLDACSRPGAGTVEPLEVRFPEPLDRALLDRLIVVQRLCRATGVPGQRRRERLRRPAGGSLPNSPWRHGRVSPRRRYRARRRGRQQRGAAVRGRCQPRDLPAHHQRDGDATVSDRRSGSGRSPRGREQARVAQPAVEIRWA